MKKTLIVLISAIFISVTSGIAAVSSDNSTSYAYAVRVYKSGNYTLAYTLLSNIVKREPSNVPAYYYLAMSSAQIGRKNEAIENYSKVIAMSDNSKLTRYAMKGLNCIESPEKCNEDLTNETDLDRFIRRQYWHGLSEEVTGDYDKQKIDELRRMINRDVEISPSKFREYRDFSTELPTEEEIADALNVLKRAGMTASGSMYSYDSAFMNSDKSGIDAISALLMSSNKNLNSDIINTLMTNQMAIGF